MPEGNGIPIKNARGAVRKKTISSFKVRVAFTVCCRSGVSINEYAKRIRTMLLSTTHILVLLC